MGINRHLKSVSTTMKFSAVTLVATAALAQNNCQTQGPVQVCASPSSDFKGIYVYYNKNTGYIQDTGGIFVWMQLGDNQKSFQFSCDPRGGGYCDFYVDPTDAELFKGVTNVYDLQFAFYNGKGQWDSKFGQNYKFHFQ
ncbi:hypothetical protein HDV01_004719 [Terramyces sp. JEL0728]|nr:hypothetical protein HDV01_004719 [Terramyces sp. JEL0728]